MKKSLGVAVVAVALVLCFILSACGGVTRYRNKYSATFMVTTNTSDNASVSFDSFSGTQVIRLKNNGDDEVFIDYDATLGEGNIKVYYDFNGEKLSMFEIEEWSSLDGRTEAFKGNKTIYIIIESDGECKDGSFSFALKKV